ncbi:MAG: hypothetical protein ACRETW_15920, partial [Stenotrophobium sp.]
MKIEHRLFSISQPASADTVTTGSNPARKLASGFAAALLAAGTALAGSTVAMAATAPPVTQHPAQPLALKTAPHAVAAKAGIHLPVYFEPAADGQRYVVRNAGYAVTLGQGNAELRLKGKSGATAIVDLDLAGANRVAAQPQGKLPGHSSYFYGRNPMAWRSGVPQYAGVHYANVYPGIDVDYRASANQRLESDFTVSAGADPSRIRMKIAGVQSRRIAANGDLLL